MEFLLWFFILSEYTLYSQFYKQSSFRNATTMSFLLFLKRIKENMIKKISDNRAFLNVQCCRNCIH